jgi:transposase-like protein
VQSENYPETLLELERRFADEESCRQYLFDLRWPEGFRCPRCNGSQAWKMSRGLWLCGGCRHQVSVTAGTIFQDMRYPLRVWFRAIWQVTSQKYGASALGVMRVLGFGSYQTAWAWLHKLRRAMVRPGRDRLSGTIEVDEVYVGGERSGPRGRGATGKALVLIAAQADGAKIGRIRLVRIANASGPVLVEAVGRSVEPGSQVLTDGWKGYEGLAAQGFVHEVVRATAIVGENLLPRAHRVASLLQRWLLGTHQGAVGHAQLEYYLDEFTFRFNRRTSRHRGKLFYRLVQQAVQVPPQPFKSLIAPQPVAQVESSK